MDSESYQEEADPWEEEQPHCLHVDFLPPSSCLAFRMILYELKKVETEEEA